MTDPVTDPKTAGPKAVDPVTAPERSAVFLTILPGLGLVSAVALTAAILAQAQAWAFGQIWLGTIVLAILLGAILHSWRGVATKYHQGIRFCAKWLLEVAVCLMGASISYELLESAGLVFVASIMAVVIVSILASYAIGKALGLTSDQALLVACGNSICGNSAIASVAALIGAKPEDVASSIAFTAILGIGVALALPLVQKLTPMDYAEYGVLAGMMVYAVPQVLAATMPVGTLATQMGTLTKLVRVLMLGPVLILAAIVYSAKSPNTGSNRGESSDGAKAPARSLSLNKILPWFIIGFFALMAARSMGWIDGDAARIMAWLADSQAILAMAALGLTVNLRSLAQSSGRVVLAALASLMVLAGLSFGLIALLGLT